jgi:hypothetical protein
VVRVIDFGMLGMIGIVLILCLYDAASRYQFGDRYFWHELRISTSRDGYGRAQATVSIRGSKSATQHWCGRQSRQNSSIEKIALEDPSNLAF